MRRQQEYFALALVLAGTVACLVYFTNAPSLKSAREAAKLASCHGLRLGVIAMACQQYHAAYGTFPPAYIADAHGKPMHSWRVLLLPFMECQDLYSRYDFSEPWNGPNNRRLAEFMPSVYACPSYRGGKKGMTNYVAVVGPQTAWPGGRGVARSSINEYLTISIVEVADSDYRWLEPRDMSLEQAIQGVNVDLQHGISSYHRGGANCALIDGTVEFLPDGTKPNELEALLTISGGEPVPTPFPWDRHSAD